jgi:Ner family transcriptional regulator
MSRHADWDHLDIVFALRKRGLTLKGLSERHKLHRSALGQTKYTSWPRAERIIADALGEQPSAIWPSRYDSDGRPIKRGAKALSSRKKRVAHQ